MGNDSSKLPIIEKSQCNKYIQNKPCSSNIQKKLLKIYFRKWNFEQLYLKFICKNRYNLFYGYFNYWLKEANIFSELSKYFNIWYTNIFSNKYNKYKIKKVFKYWKYLSKEKNLLYNYSKFYYTFNLLQKKKKIFDILKNNNKNIKTKNLIADKHYKKKLYEKYILNWHIYMFEQEDIYYYLDNYRNTSLIKQGLCEWLTYTINEKANKLENKIKCKKFIIIWKKNKYIEEKKFENYNNLIKQLKEKNISNQSNSNYITLLNEYRNNLYIDKYNYNRIIKYHFKKWNLIIFYSKLSKKNIVKKNNIIEINIKNLKKSFKKWLLFRRFKNKNINKSTIIRNKIKEIIKNLNLLSDVFTYWKYKTYSCSYNQWKKYNQIKI